MNYKKIFNVVGVVAVAVVFSVGCVDPDGGGDGERTYEDAPHIDDQNSGGDDGGDSGSTDENDIPTIDNPDDQNSGGNNEGGSGSANNGGGNVILGIGEAWASEEQGSVCSEGLGDRVCESRDVGFIFQQDNTVKILMKATTGVWYIMATGRWSTSGNNLTIDNIAPVPIAGAEVDTGDSGDVVAIYNYNVSGDTLTLNTDRGDQVLTKMSGINPVYPPAP
jgi:hypothetical protein